MKRVSIQEHPVVYERTPLLQQENSEGLMADMDTSDDDFGEESFSRLKDSIRRESLAADRLSMRLLAVPDDDEENEARILKESLDISLYEGPRGNKLLENMQKAARQAACERFCTMVSVCLLAVALIGAALYVGVEFVGPPNQPVGPYQLVERQVRIIQVLGLGVLSRLFERFLFFIFHSSELCFGLV